MTSWQELPRAAFDLETTGRDPRNARIVTASILLVDSDGSPLEHHEWLADPGIPIPEEAAAIHGVSTEHARTYGQPAAKVVMEVAAVLARLFDAGVPVLAFNARYDFTVLEREGQRHGVSIPTPRPVLDPFIMDKQADRYRRGKRTLTAMCAHYGIDFEHAHTSAADVLATLRVGAVLAHRFPLLARPAEELHSAQLVWAERQASSFQEYLRRTDPAAVIECAWPVLPAGSPKEAEVQSVPVAAAPALLEA
ncbi:3'-5' exonuclease [Arthrobacter sp. H41]|uniref:3'-5' exonuclease n=1 Tax=Arthrobacter sp. H41 TaxID=1312978 RepID=UPI0004B1B783|nr:3'-5' exonuclease [Arthrobacter sp. H41]